MKFYNTAYKYLQHRYLRNCASIVVQLLLLFLNFVKNKITTF